MLLNLVLASNVAMPDSFTGYKYKIQEGFSPIIDPLFVLVKTVYHFLFITDILHQMKQQMHMQSSEE
jgi:hypothetical protein